MLARLLTNGYNSCISSISIIWGAGDVRAALLPVRP